MEVHLKRSEFFGVIGHVAAAIKADPHHRLLSWDHAWNHWKSYVSEAKQDESLAALHLAFYLASWGMYRGSSDLLFRDFKVLVPVVGFLKAEAGTGTWWDCIFDEDRPAGTLTDGLRKLAAELGDTLKQKLARPDKQQVRPSDTLLSKILLNTLGCVPAFDTEVKAALRDILGRSYPTGWSFDPQRLTPIISLARANRALVTEGQGLLLKATGQEYPLTKVLDLYLWHHGYSLPEKPRKKE